MVSPRSTVASIYEGHIPRPRSSAFPSYIPRPLHRRCRYEQPVDTETLRGTFPPGRGRLEPRVPGPGLDPRSRAGAEAGYRGRVRIPAPRVRHPPPDPSRESDPGLRLGCASVRRGLLHDGTHRGRGLVGADGEGAAGGRCASHLDGTVAWARAPSLPRRDPWGSEAREYFA